MATILPFPACRVILDQVIYKGPCGQLQAIHGRPARPCPETAATLPIERSGAELSSAARRFLRWSRLGAVTVCIFSGWFQPAARFGVTAELRVWDVVTALRFGIGALLLAPAILLPGRRLSEHAWLKGLAFACLWGVPAS